MFYYMFVSFFSFYMPINVPRGISPLYISTYISKTKRCPEYIFTIAIVRASSNYFLPLLTI